MSQPSYIPGYKNILTETLYRPQEEYAFVNDVKTTVIPQSPNIMIEKNGPFASAYYQQYESNTPYKNSVLTPSLYSSNNAVSTHKPCNPLVTYPFGVPQDVSYEKCAKCKGDKKCHKKCHKKKNGNKNINNKNKNVENGNANVNDLDLFTCKLRPEEDFEEVKETIETDISNEEGCEQCICATLTSGVSQCSNNNETCNYCTKTNNQENNENDDNDNKGSDYLNSLSSPYVCNNNNVMTESDIMQSTFTYNSCDFPSKDLQEKSEFFCNEEFLLNNNIDICGNKTYFNDINMEREMTYENGKLSTKLNNEDINEQLSIQENEDGVSIEKIVDGLYDLDFNPFEEEFDAEKAAQYKKRIETRGESRIEENKTEDVSAIDTKQSISKIQINSNNNSNSKKDLEEDLDGEETSPTKNSNGKNSEDINNTNSDNKINDEDQTKSIKKITPDNKISSENKPRVYKSEHNIKEAIKNDAESKNKVYLNETLKTSMSNADDLFSPKSPKHNAKTQISQHKNSSKNGLKLKASKKLNLTNSNVLTSSTKKNFILINKNINDSKKKGLLTEVSGTDSAMKTPYTPSLLKKKNKINEQNKKNLNQNKAKENTGNISIKSVKGEVETGRVTPKPMLNGSTKKSYGKNKNVALKNINSNVGSVSKNKEFANKIKGSEITESSKKTDIIKNEKANVYSVKKNTSTLARETVAKKLKSKKKELYNNILSLTQNIKENSELEKKKKNEETKN